MDYTFLHSYLIQVYRGVSCIHIHTNTNPPHPYSMEYEYDVDEM